MKRFLTFVRFDETSKNIEKEIISSLCSNGFIYDDVNPEIVIVVGGDGTFLNAVHKIIDKIGEVIFYGIHTGTLGFFTDYKSDQLDEFLDDLLNKEAKIREYQLLEVTLDNNERYYAVNEMRIENISRTQVMNILVDDNEFETFRGTGMCVSTQLGSTAYNRSLNGAVVQDGLPLIQMSEIAGIHHKEYRSLGVPIIMSENSRITFESDNFDDAYLCVDAFNYKLDDIKKVNVVLGDKKVRLLRFKDVSYFKKLQSLF
ncbi:MAG: NAD kinase [Erysipelotrichaceae bacterium]|nr:NAD kinase [Erysipelotrichaceae bacterium]